MQLQTPSAATTANNNTEVILVVGHGSRDPEGVVEFQLFVQNFSQALAPRTVSACFLELSDPPILAEIERWVGLGVKTITLVPFFLLAAGHVKNDVPSAINLARLHYPQIHFQYGAPIGPHHLILEILQERLLEAEQHNPSQLAASDTAILLVERGSSDPDANSEVYKVARLLWESCATYKSVEVSFIGITAPLVADGIERCVALGAKRVLVLPYFLFTGVLVKRINTITLEKQEQYPALEFVTAPHIGPDYKLVEIALDQLAQIEGGQVIMSCDLCKYRVRLTGFEADLNAPQGSDHSHGLRGEHSHQHEHSHSHSGDTHHHHQH
jgi:sirohydrochlorin cobaltochelatase